MKTVIKATAAALCLLAVLCTLAFAQAEKQKIAVYMAGDEPQGAMGSHKMVGGELVNEIIRSRDYSAIDRTEAILAQLVKEHGYQRGGAVSDNQIKALGQQFGVDFLCIVEISAVQGGTFYLSVRLVNVVTAEAVKSATTVSNLRDGNEMMRVAQYLARELVGRGVGQLVQVATQPQQKVVPVQQAATQQWAVPAQQAEVTQQTSTVSPQNRAMTQEEMISRMRELERSREARTNVFIDPRDGKTYRIVRIGNLTWMAENLNYQTGNSLCYDNNQSNCQKYGRLYDWNTAMMACPAGWRLPTRQDWKDLIRTTGGSAAGKKLKSRTDWNGTDDFAFSALPGGSRNAGGKAGTHGYWWSATKFGGGHAWGQNMRSGNTYLLEESYYTHYGLSVRCLRD